MKQSKKALVFTGTRAEYGLLMPLIKQLDSSECYQLQLLVAGSHLSPEFGLTYKEIEADGYHINAKCEMLLASDTSLGVAKSAGLGLIDFAKELERLQPDFIVILGDRFEALSMATAAMLMKCPIVHFHGGETSEGAFDEAIRHSISKMSHIHFTATEKYRNRVIQLGEDPSRVFHVGAIGLDNIKDLELLDRGAFEDSIDFKLREKNVLVTFHPATLCESSPEDQFKELLAGLDFTPEVGVILTMPNCDTNSRGLMAMVQEYVDERENCVCFTSLGQLRYLSALQHVDAVLGNSSSGLIEAPSFGVPTINVGDRQLGRDSGLSVIHCGANRLEIRDSLFKAFDARFLADIANEKNIYGEGGVVPQVLKVLAEVHWEQLLMKKFYDLK